MAHHGRCCWISIASRGPTCRRCGSHHLPRSSRNLRNQGHRGEDFSRILWLKQDFGVTLTSHGITTIHTKRHKSSSFKPSQRLWHLFRHLLRYLLWHLLWHLLMHLLHLLRHHRRYVGWRAQSRPSTQSAQGSSTHGVEGGLLTNVTCTSSGHANSLTKTLIPMPTNAITLAPRPASLVEFCATENKS